MCVCVFVCVPLAEGARVIDLGGSVARIHDQRVRRSNDGTVTITLSFLPLSITIILYFYHSIPPIINLSIYPSIPLSTALELAITLYL